MRVGGIVLCGGRSSRMGRPKAWLPVGDELMLQRVVRVLREAVGPVVAVAALGQDMPPLPREVEVVRDEIEGRGPLQGLAAGLAALDGRADAVYLSACDVPFLTSAFVTRVVGFLEEPLPPAPSPKRGGGERQKNDPPARHIVRGQWIEEGKVARSRELRRAMTPAERALWARLRRNLLGGLHFRRQQVIDGFIADFYCHSAGLVVEVDGSVHDGAAEYDADRDRVFAARGLRILRVRNEQVLASIDSVLSRIAEACRPQPLPPAPSPKRGGGERRGDLLSSSPPLLGEGSGEGLPSIAVPRAGGHHHPLAAAYRLSVRPAVAELLAAGRLRPVFLFDAVPTRIITSDELPTLDPLRNLNTPDDYAAALRDLS